MRKQNRIFSHVVKQLNLCRPSIMGYAVFYSKGQWPIVLRRAPHPCQFYTHQTTAAVAIIQSQNNAKAQNKQAPNRTAPNRTAPQQGQQRQWLPGTVNCTWLCKAVYWSLQPAPAHNPSRRIQGSRTIPHRAIRSSKIFKLSQLQAGKESTWNQGLSPGFFIVLLIRCEHRPGLNPWKPHVSKSLKQLCAASPYTAAPGRINASTRPQTLC